MSGPRTYSSRVSFLACAFYAFVSIGITFFNKIVLSTYSFKWPNIMTLFQILFSLFFLICMRKFGYVSYPNLSTNMAIKTSPLSLSFLGMVLTGLGALKYLNIPMFNALRRATTLITMSGEYYLLGVKSSLPVQISVYLMVFGAIVAGIFDFDYSFIGYFLVALNCVFTATYLLAIAKFGKQAGLNSFGLMYYNNLQSLPVVVLICFFNGDFATDGTGVWDYKFANSIGFWVYFLFQSALAFLLNYSIFLCTNINSALATSVTGQIKNIATTAVGYIAFGDVTYNFINVVGLGLGVIASSWYSWLKYEESEAKKKETILPVHEFKPVPQEENETHNQ